MTNLVLLIVFIAIGSLLAGCFCAWLGWKLGMFEPGGEAMTDKAAREAFEKYGLRVQMYLATEENGEYADTLVFRACQDFLAGYQAAHDAAMAAEPTPDSD